MPPGNLPPPYLLIVVAWSASFLYILRQRFSSGGRLIPPADKSGQILTKNCHYLNPDPIRRLVDARESGRPKEPCATLKKKGCFCQGRPGKKDLACRLHKPHPTLGHIRRPKWKKEVHARGPKAAAAGHPRKTLRRNKDAAKIQSKS
jgi:hypothetical protein